MFKPTAKIITDSISPIGQRITTMELEYPRFIHSEFMTHREFSRNSASSRAIPIDKVIEQVAFNPAIPIHWGLNQSGMQAKDEQANIDACKEAWCNARDSAIHHAYQLKNLGLHKQIVNRILEPFCMMKTLVTATSFDNFFHLRLHKDAQPEIQQLAHVMYEAMKESKPIQLKQDEWHTPYYGNGYWNVHSDDDLETALMISCSCSAQVSYRKTDTSIDKAKAIYDKLVNSQPVHASAFEHCATPIIDGTQKGITHFRSDGMRCSANFVEWIQYRQLIPNHDCKEFKYD